MAAFSSLTFIIGGCLVACMLGLLVLGLWWRACHRGGGCVLWRPRTWAVALADPAYGASSQTGAGCTGWGLPGLLR